MLARRTFLRRAAVLGTAISLPLCVTLVDEEGRDDVEGPLFARVIGSGEPVLFLHGLAASGAYWGEAYDSFADSHRLAFVDLAGFGRSLHLPGPFDLDGQLARLAAFRQQRLGTDRVTIVGHSFGALLALLAASRWANVRGVVALSLPALTGTIDERWRQVEELGVLAALTADNSGLGKFICKIQCATRPVARELAPLFMPSLPDDVARATLDHHWRSARGALEGVVDAEPARWIAATKAAVVVVQGTHDEVSSPALVRQVLRGLPVEVREVEGGHQLPLTNPAVCRAALASLLGT
ncbi:MAG: alpha/beta hydrolase [Deltaproteobacteria bacterium]|nr:alpha/beta hydrolase [Deltaproteobacteria bacterium]